LGLSLQARRRIGGRIGNTLLLLLLDLLLPLLQFLQELFRSFHSTRLSERIRLLWLWLIVSLSRGSLIIRVGGVRSIGGVVTRVIGIRRLRRNHASLWLILRHGSGRLLCRLVARAGAGSEDDPIERNGILCRPQQNVVEMRSIQQRSQHITSWPGAELSDHAFRGIARHVDRCPSLLAHRPQNVA